MLVAINHHYVRESFEAPHPAVHGLTPQGLRAHLESLSRLGEFVSPLEVRDAVAGCGKLPEQALLITFDDGLKEQHDLAWPILKDMGIPAIFFVNTGPIAERTVSLAHKIHILRSEMPPEDFEAELRRVAVSDGVEIDASDQGKSVAQYRYDTSENARLKYLLNFVLDRDTLARLLARLFVARFGAFEEARRSRALYMERSEIYNLAQDGAIGSHGHEHLPLGLLDADESRSMIEQSTRLLEEWTGLAPFAFSYPYGSRESCAGSVVEQLEQSGFDYALTMERAANFDLSRPMLMARFDANDMPGGKAPLADAASFFESVPGRSWHAETHVR